AFIIDFENRYRRRFATQANQRSRRLSFEIGRLAQQDDAHVDTRGRKYSRRNHPVTAVVTLAAERERSFSPGITAQTEARGCDSSRIHQRRQRDACLIDRSL